MAPNHQRTRLVRLLLEVTIGALAVAALSGVVVLVSGDVDDTGWQVLATSAAFGIACTLAAAGAELYAKPLRAARPVGAATVVTVGVADLLLTIAIWAQPDSEAFGRVSVTAWILAVQAGFAAFVLARRRPRDTTAIRALVATALLAAGVGCALAAALVWEIAPDSDVSVRVFGVVVIVQLFAGLVSLLARRLQRDRPLEPSADELDAIAQRLEHATTVAEARQEAQRLHEVARASRR